VTVVDTARAAAASAMAHDKQGGAAVLGVVESEHPSSDVHFLLGQVLMLIVEYASPARVLYVDAANTGTVEPLPAIAPTLVASVLPVSRAIASSGTATAFATVINTGATTAQGCAIALPSTVPATLGYQTTSAQTNALTGTADTAVDIAPGAAQTFVFAIRPTSAFPQTDIDLVFSCASGQFATPLTAVNTFLLTSSTQPTPDMVALAATPANDGVVRVTGTSAAGFSVATVNVGVAGDVVASAEGRGPAAAFVALSICQTDASARCVQPPAATVSSSFAADQTATYSVFVAATGAPAAFDPSADRVFVRFRSPAGASLGATSVALQVQ
jgi:hypothetical protein